MVKSLQGLRERRDNLLLDIQKDQEEKAEVDKKISSIKEQLFELTQSLQRKEEIKNEFDQVIKNTESAYLKLLEGSQTLLQILKRDEKNLLKKLQNEN